MKTPRDRLDPVLRDLQIQLDSHAIRSHLTASEVAMLERLRTSRIEELVSRGYEVDGVTVRKRKKEKL